MEALTQILSLETLSSKAVLFCILEHLEMATPVLKQQSRQSMPCPPPTYIR